MTSDLGMVIPECERKIEGPIPMVLMNTPRTTCSDVLSKKKPVATYKEVLGQPWHGVKQLLHADPPLQHLAIVTAFHIPTHIELQPMVLLQRRDAQPAVIQTIFVKFD